MCRYCKDERAKNELKKLKNHKNKFTFDLHNERPELLVLTRALTLTNFYNRSSIEMELSVFSGWRERKSWSWNLVPFFLYHRIVIIIIISPDVVARVGETFYANHMHSKAELTCILDEWIVNLNQFNEDKSFILSSKLERMEKFRDYKLNLRWERSDKDGFI